MCKVWRALSLFGLAVRLAILGLGLSGLLPCASASPARAADLDVLRGSDATTVPPLTVGPATFTRWSGVYVGGSFSYGGSSVDFSQATQPLLAFVLRDTALEEQVNPSSIPVLGRDTANAAGFGGFVGYNFQFQDLIVGIEGTYTHTHLNVVAPQTPIAGTADSPGRVFTVGSNTDSIDIFGSGNMTLTDYGTLRTRAGVVLGNVLPYGFVGFAVGLANYNITTSAIQGQSSETPPFPCVPNGGTCQFFNFSNSAGQNGALLYGFSAGAGVDWAVTPNIFLRGEFEFVQFTPIAGINPVIYTARVGGGFKF
jgi:outer membrane immunogenic protein